MADLGARLLGIDAQQLEHRCLQLLTMDAHRATANLRAVERQIVGIGQRATGIGAQCLRILVLGRGEGMVHGHPAPLGLIPFEHRKVDDPDRTPAGLDEAQVRADAQTQCTD